MDKKRVLIFPAGSEIGLEIFDSLKYSHHVQVYGATSRSDHAAFAYPSGHCVEDPRLNITQPGFLAHFNALLQRLQIEFVYPTHDSVACMLAEHQAELSARVIGSEALTNRIARSKRLTYQTLSDFDFCPAVLDTTSPHLPYPVFLKPDQGEGGRGAVRVDDAQALAFHLRRSPELVATEYLPGAELSIDCFTDGQGRLLFVGPRTRERVQMGISFRSSAQTPDEELQRIAAAINRTVALRGAWFFQVKQAANGRYKLLEFAARQSSTMGLYRHAGVNFALLSLFDAMGLPVAVQTNAYTSLTLDRRLQSRYRADLAYRRVYIDFDETIIAEGRPHGRVMDYLYQCRNRGVEIVLITKHRHKLADTLEQCAISPRLFDRIIQLGFDQAKADFIEPDGAIFIDNHWPERREVRQRWGMPVFDVDAVECLMR